VIVGVGFHRGKYLNKHAIRILITFFCISIIWIGLSIYTQHKLSGLSISTKPIKISSIGSADIEAISNDVIVPIIYGDNFQFDAFFSTAPSNEGNWRSGTKGLSLLPLSVLTSLAISKGLFEKPSEDTLQILLSQAIKFLINERGILESQLLRSDVKRQLNTEIIFWNIDKLRKSQNYGVLYQLYNELLETDLLKPIAVEVSHLPHFSDYNIKQVVLLPVFNYKNNKPAFSHQELKKRIENCVRNAFFHLKQTTHKIAIPALAGTETRQDSGSYLTYQSSYSSILAGIRNVSARIDNLDKIYLVVWDKLKKNNPSEFSYAIKGLKWAFIEHYFITSKILFFLIFISTLILSEFLAKLRKDPVTNIRVAFAAAFTIFLWVTSLFGNTSWILKIFEKADSILGIRGIFLSQIILCLLMLYLIDMTPYLRRLIKETEKKLDNNNVNKPISPNAADAKNRAAD